MTAYILDESIALGMDKYVESGTTWLPMFGSIGTTASLYLLAVNISTLVVIPVMAFLPGQGHGRAK